MKDQIRIKSSTGCVHIVNNAYDPPNGGHIEYSTLCNHVDYYQSYTNNTHTWKETSEPVTCKRCIKAYTKDLERSASLIVFSKQSLQRDGLTHDSTFLEAKHKLQWGTYGKEGKDPLTWVKLIDCSTSHLNALLITQPQIPNITVLIIESILEDRKGKY